MPNKARDHRDMLDLCCGICGIKKNPKCLKTINDVILQRIKLIDGYADYNINDDRYPNVICQEHYYAINEISSGKPLKDRKFKLPKSIPPFHDVEFTGMTHIYSRTKMY